MLKYTIHTTFPPTTASRMDHVILASSEEEAVDRARLAHRLRIFEWTAFLVGVYVTKTEETRSVEP